MRVLVTGGAGYIGSVVAAQLLAAGADVVVVDDLSTGHADAVPPGAEFHRLGVADLEPVLAGWRVNAVVHFAAKSLVGESTENPALYWRTNVVGTVALLDAMRASGVGRIVFSSSAATYGSPDLQPIVEDAPARPGSPYGSSKLAVDLVLADYARAYGLAATSLRYFNVAGALIADAGSYGERHATETHLIPTALRAAANGTPMSLFGTDYPTPDGTCIRDYVHVVDLGEAHLRALDSVEPGSAPGGEPRKRSRVLGPRGAGDGRSGGRARGAGRGTAAPRGRSARARGVERAGARGARVATDA